MNFIVFKLFIQIILCWIFLASSRPQPRVWWALQNILPNEMVTFKKSVLFVLDLCFFLGTRLANMHLLRIKQVSDSKLIHIETP